LSPSFVALRDKKVAGDYELPEDGQKKIFEAADQQHILNWIVAVGSQ
jgi:hypothetical protein